MQFDLPHRVARLTDSQVVHVVSRLPGAGKPDYRPVPERERSSMGPLSVLAWGGGKR